MSDWKSVSVPHDWAIYGSRLTGQRPSEGDSGAEWRENGNTEDRPHRRTALYRQGYYRTTFEVPDTAGQVFSFEFDGAMSNPRVKVNGKRSVTGRMATIPLYINVPAGVDCAGKTVYRGLFGKQREISRWYPGAGLYRNVRLVTTSPVHVPTQGAHM